MNITLDDVVMNVVANIIATLILMLIGFISGYLFLLAEKKVSYKSRQEKRFTRFAFSLLLTILAILSPSQLDDARLASIFAPIPVVVTAGVTVKENSRRTHFRRSQKRIENFRQSRYENVRKPSSLNLNRIQSSNFQRQESVPKPYISPLYPRHRIYRKGHSLKRIPPNITPLYGERKCGSKKPK